jgi:hypothetical protein
MANTNESLNTQNSHPLGVTELSNSDVELFRQLTLVIMVRDKFDYVNLQLNVWRDFPVKIHVYANGDANFVPANRRGAFELSVHFNPNGYSSQLRDFSENLNTKYAVMVDDDDIASPQGMMLALKYLSINPEIGAVCGIRGTYRIFGGRIQTYFNSGRAIQVGSGEWVISSKTKWAERYFPASNTSDAPSDRVLQQLGCIWKGQGWYSIQRSSSFKTYSHLVGNVFEQCSSRSAMEVTVEFCSVWKNKMVFIPVPIHFRNLQLSSERDSRSLRHLSYDHWRKTKRYQFEFEHFVKTIDEWTRIQQPDGTFSSEFLLRVAARDSLRDYLSSRFLLLIHNGKKSKLINLILFPIEHVAREINRHWRFRKRSFGRASVHSLLTTEADTRILPKNIEYDAGKE